MKSRLEAKHENKIIPYSGIVTQIHEMYLLDNSKAKKSLTFLK